MVLNEKSFSLEVLDFIEHYNFGIGRLSIQCILKSSRFWISNFEKLKHTLDSLNNFKWKYFQLQSSSIDFHLKKLGHFYAASILETDQIDNHISKSDF
jgi:hypothetical protein